jgi:hypothetical protein
MVAAFNGGFRLADHVGGYYYAGRTVRSLRNGLAAFVISAAGRLTVGAWGRDLHLVRGTQVVRQNLPLLVDGGRTQTRSTDTTQTWGIANGNLWTANRSALGQLPNGSLVYAYGFDVRPTTMAHALVLVGARTGMFLDMNKSWPGGFTYVRVGDHLHGQRVQPGEYHDPSVYFHRFTKDFVVALVPT